MLGVRSISKFVACLCLLLTLCSAVEVIVHHHSTQTDASACQVCVAAHSTTPTTISPAPKPVFRTILTLHLRQTATTERFIAFGLRVRPPPPSV